MNVKGLFLENAETKDLQEIIDQSANKRVAELDDASIEIFMNVRKILKIRKKYFK